jgi:hypothetical protein
LIELNGLVRQIIQSAKEDEKRRAAKKRTVFEEKSRDNKTYRLVSIRCGKENCKCAKGKGTALTGMPFGRRTARPEPVMLEKRDR